MVWKMLQEAKPIRRLDAPSAMPQTTTAGFSVKLDSLLQLGQGIRC
jgi:hypothetical protein